MTWLIVNLFLFSKFRYLFRTFSTAIVFQIVFLNCLNEPSFISIHRRKVKLFQFKSNYKVLFYLHFSFICFSLFYDFKFYIIIFFIFEIFVYSDKICLKLRFSNNFIFPYFYLHSWKLIGPLFVNIRTLFIPITGRWLTVNFPVTSNFKPFLS